MAKTKTGGRRKRGVAVKQRAASSRRGRDGTLGRSTAGDGPAATRQGNRSRGATRTARRQLDAPRIEAAEPGSNARSRAGGQQRGRGTESPAAADIDMREGDNPRAASAESGVRQDQLESE